MVEEDWFGNGNILAVPSEFYFAASFLFKKKKIHASKASVI